MGRIGIKLQWALWAALGLAAAWAAASRAQDNGEGGAAAAADPPVDMTANLTSQLATRDKYIVYLEGEAEARDAKIQSLEAQLQVKNDELTKANKLLSFEKSLNEFQEKQIAKLREVVREQREQLNQLRDLRGP